MPRLLRLLDQLAPAVPDSTEVLAGADRGLYSKDLFEAIQNKGWHPLLRIPRLGHFRPKASENQPSENQPSETHSPEAPQDQQELGQTWRQTWRPVSRLLPQPGLCY